MLTPVATFAKVLRYGAYLRSIPPSHRVGDYVHATSRVVNSLNRVSSITSGQGASQGTTQYGFDANGEAVSQTDPLNHTTTQTLDALRRPTSTTLPDNSSTQTAWTALGELASAKDPKGITTTYQRNAWSEILSDTSPDSGTQSYIPVLLVQH